MATNGAKLRQEISALASAEFDDPTRVDYTWLHRLHEGGRRYWDGQRPVPVDLVTLVFTRLGIDPGDSQLANYIKSYTDEFKQAAKDLKLTEERHVFGEKIHQQASVRTAFGNLRDAIDDFHGAAYEYEITTAENLGYFVISQSLEADTLSDSSESDSAA